MVLPYVVYFGQHARSFARPRHRAEVSATAPAVEWGSNSRNPRPRPPRRSCAGCSFWQTSWVRGGTARPFPCRPPMNPSVTKGLPAGLGRSSSLVRIRGLLLVACRCADVCFPRLRRFIVLVGVFAGRRREGSCGTTTKRGRVVWFEGSLSSF